MNWFKRLFVRRDVEPPTHRGSGGQPDKKAKTGGEPTRDQFAALVLDRLRGSGTDGFTYDPDAFRIRKGDRQAFLDNAYAEYRHAEGERRESVLARMVALLTAEHPEAEAGFEEVRDQLVTVVRERAYFSLSALDLRLHGPKTPVESVAEPLTRWFVKALVVDAPTHMSIVNEDMLARWHHTSDELFAFGLENLRGCTVPRFSEDRRVFRGAWNDDYDSSRILVPGLFAGLDLDGDPVVTLPNRLTLLVAGSNEPDAIRRMLEAPEKVVQNEPRPQNPAPLLVQPDGSVSDFHVDPTAPVFDAVERAHRFAALMYYQGQKDKLDRLHAREGRSLHVAAYTLVQLEGGLYCSYAPWPKGEPTLLPVVDEVAFIDIGLPEDRRCVARVPWARVLEVVPGLLLDARLFPERYYVSQFPTEAQLERMRR